MKGIKTVPFLGKSVTFATKCYGKDYHHFLSGAFERKKESCLYDFDDSFLILNNGVPNAKFSPKTFNILDEQAETLDFFNLSDSDFIRNGQNGYWYSIAELTAIRLAKTDYLCWVQGDCIMEPYSDWVTPGIKILESDPTISVVSPGSECNTYGEIDQEFSDQAFLIRVPEFQQQIYSWDGPEQPNYPDHGGRSFEYICGQYLKNNGKGRVILYDSNLLHPQY